MEKLPKMQNPRRRTDATHTSTLRLVWPAFVFRMVTKANPVSAAGTSSIGSTRHPFTSISVEVVFVGIPAMSPGATAVTDTPW